MKDKLGLLMPIKSKTSLLLSLYQATPVYLTNESSNLIPSLSLHTQTALQEKQKLAWTANFPASLIAPYWFKSLPKILKLSEATFSVWES